ncbi:MAG: hypothetical protein NUW01_11385 [Gemmatimonadaceae bacterium]|nr:hypothetical protein [Gemmatimonadaceae bacterium]
MLRFWTTATSEARRALVAASGGWLLNAFDVMLYALVLSELIAAFGKSLGLAGQIGRSRCSRPRSGGSSSA